MPVAVSMFSHTVPVMNTYVVSSDPGSRHPRDSAASRSAVQDTIMPSATSGTSGLSTLAETALNDRAPPITATANAATIATVIITRGPDQPPRAMLRRIATTEATAAVTTTRAATLPVATITESGRFR